MIEYFLTQAVGCDPNQDKDNNEQALTSEGLILRLTSEVKPKVFCAKKYLTFRIRTFLDPPGSGFLL